MSEKRRVFLLIFIMTCIAIVVAGVSLFALYRVAVDQQRERVVDIVNSRASLMEEVARFDIIHSADFPGGARVATLSQIENAHHQLLSFAKTGEFILAQKEGDEIVFLWRHHHHDLEKPKPVPLSSSLAEPMRRALSGQSGSVVGLDYRGERVLAAYEPVPSLDLGLVAKIDLGEIRAPFLRAGLLAGGFGLLAILFGAYAFLNVTNPMLRRIQENENKFRTLTTSSPAGIFQADAQGNNVYANEAVCSFTGLPANKLEGAGWATALHPEDRDRVYKLWMDTVTGNASFETEFRFLGKRKQVTWVLSQGTPLKDEDGNITGFIGTLTDITEHKQAEEALRDSESRLEALSGASFEAIFLSKKGVCLDQNQTAESMFGYTRAEAVGRHGTEWIVLEDREKVKNNMLSGYENPYEVNARRKDGTTFSCEIQARMVNHKGRSIRITALRDITERKRADEKLRESEEKYRFLAEKMADIVWTVDLNFRTTYVSPSVEKVLGYTPEERKSQSLEEIVVPASFQRVQARLLEELQREEDPMADPHRPIIIEVEYYRKDGSTIFMENTVKALRDPEGTIIGIYGVSRDITERKQTEEDKAKLEGQLRQAQKMEAIGTLAGGIAHDFNNILGIIVGNTELALNDVPEWNPARANLGEVIKASLRARDIVRQILAFSRQTEQQKKLARLGPIIQDILKMLRASIPTTVEFREEILTEADTVMADLTQINQILLNLATNAAHAMQERGGVLCVRLENRTLDETALKLHRALKPGAWVVMTVSDTGHGISPEILERIFDPYFTTKDVGEGTGMGLSVVNGIVQNHGGALLVRSEPGRGADFEIYLPFIEEEADLEKETVSPLPTGTERILVVDDEESLALLVTRMLEHLQYDVTMTTSSMKALELFREKPDQFDLVITDMTMPLLPGTELSLELMRIRLDIPVILCTGFSERVSPAQAENLGIRAFLEKPLSMRVLAETVRKVLDGEAPT